MEVKCTICDKIDTLEDDSFLAKRLRNRRSYMYLCDECNDRITEKTNARHATGKFRLYRDKKDEEEYI
jgi:uncharacterized protein YlaI